MYMSPWLVVWHAVFKLVELTAVLGTFYLVLVHVRGRR